MSQQKMATFASKLLGAMGENGYSKQMRRSIQTIVLYEAYRIIKDKLHPLRPFQRKLALMDQAKALVAELDCIPYHDKSTIFWRTASSQEVMDSETAWKRMRMIEKDLERLAAKAKPLCTEGKSPEKVNDELVQQLYEEASGSTDPCPRVWEHNNNHLIMAYRMYYRGDQLDRNFPPPQSPIEILVPTTKPEDDVDKGGPFTDEIEEPAEYRREMIKEIGDHLNLLKEFEGSIPETELTKKRLALFAALPNAPPSREERGKKRRMD